MSGKGGVGKTFVAAAIAQELVKRGWQTGLLDLDTDGPNQNRVLGIIDKEITTQGIQMKPIEKDGLKVVSVGSHPCVIGNQPTVWRGEHRREFVRQCILNIDWGDIRWLVADYPPGLSDQIVSLKKHCPDSVAVLVSAPSRVSTDNCEAVVLAAQKLKVPILGIIENMAYFECQCGKRHYIFGKLQAKVLAEKYGLKYYGEIPINPEIAKANDEGRPVSHPIIGKVVDDIEALKRGLWREVKDKLKGAIGVGSRSR